MQNQYYAFVCKLSPQCAMCYCREWVDVGEILSATQRIMANPYVLAIGEVTAEEIAS